MYQFARNTEPSIDNDGKDVWLVKDFDYEKDTYFIIAGLQSANTGSEHQLCEDILVMVYYLW